MKLWCSWRTVSAPVLGDEELLAAIDSDQHADDVVHAPASGAAAGVCINGVGLPAVC